MQGNGTVDPIIGVVTALTMAVNNLADAYRMHGGGKVQVKERKVYIDERSERTRMSQSGEKWKDPAVLRRFAEAMLGATDTSVGDLFVAAEITPDYGDKARVERILRRFRYSCYRSPTGKTRPERWRQYKPFEVPVDPGLREELVASMMNDIRELAVQ